MSAPAGNPAANAKCSWPGCRGIKTADQHWCLEGRMCRAIKPDAQAFDEVRIMTVPRYKTSGLSGDGWRISATIQLLRKGRVIAEKRTSTVEKATMILPGFWLQAIGDGKAHFGGEGDFCDQEGCAEKATVTLRLKKLYCDEGHPSDPRKLQLGHVVRKFCARHSQRGDCALEDADKNYEVVDGSQITAQPSDRSPSGFAGVVSVDPAKESDA